MTTAKLHVVFVWLVAISIGSIPEGSGRVLELSDRFLEVSKQGYWLVKFYAPWCGHCKRLEPVWNQVAQSLHHSSVRVGRVDCTRFSAVATEYNVRGFPTILFLKGDTTFTYRGDRNREEIVEFALRLEGPAVKAIQTREAFVELSIKYEVFFLIVGNRDDFSELSVAFDRVANSFHAYSDFYSAQNEVVPEELRTSDSVGPSVCVVKDGMHYTFERLSDVDVDLNASLATWVARERFPFFVKFTHGSLPQLLKTEKLLVIGVLEENLIGKLITKMEEFRDMLKEVALENKDKLHGSFLFGWTPHPSVANSLAMQRLPIPGLVVVDSVTYEYYVPDDDPSQLTADAIVTFLGQILDKSAKVYGGNGILTKIYRVYYDASTSLADIWSGNPVLTTVLFGLPLGFLLLILYSIFCADIMDAADEEDEDESRSQPEDSNHEKRE